MKKIRLTLLSLLFCAITFAQSVPQGINYQALARDASGAVLMNQNLTIQFSVISDITTSAVSWQETHLVITNGYGLYTAIIGQGTSTNGGSSLTFDVIDWGASNHLLKVEVDYGGGLLDMGITAFMSVPYAINSANPGPAGANGLDGLDGLDGVNGTNGVDGAAGTDGANGTNGVDGAAGQDGAVGANGAAGVAGLIGATGAQGFPGSVGATGATGTNGVDGAAGQDGAVGANGAAGVAGSIGATGAQGLTGAAGVAGSIGATGAQGFPGAVGATGATGTNGVDGAQGLTGAAGTDGVNGTNGVDGTDGIGIAQTLYISGDTLFITSGNYIILPALGCTDATATNYNAAANTDDGSCIINGCTDITAFNYNAAANTDDGSCIAVVNGCTILTATNYNASANTNDGSCIGACIGCAYQGGIVFYLDGNGGGLIAAPSDQGNTLWGCWGIPIAGADGTAIGTGAQNTIDIEAGCTSAGTAADICANLTLNGYSDWFLPSKDELNEMYLNIGQGNIGGFSTTTFYWSSTEIDHSNAWGQGLTTGVQFSLLKSYWQIEVRAVRAFSSIPGCMDPTALNYNAAANTDDGSCIAVVNGCTDSTAVNYNAAANTDDGSCISVVNGCTDPTATNYNAAANTDDGSCISVVNGCTDPTATNYNAAANTDDGSCIGGLSIGDTYGGGIVFYLDGNGGGLIAAPTDQSAGAEWGCYGTNISGADGIAIGTGAQNTIDIVNANCSPNNPVYSIAADICANLTLGGYSDWFLPSKDELNKMHQNIGLGNALGLGNIGGFATNYYWSSSEYYFDDALTQYFGNGTMFYNDKYYPNYVRAVRAF
jgi:hypothetical protein